MGNILTKAHETVGVETKVSFLISLTVPRETNPGNYTFFVNLTYKDTSTTGEDYFIVKSKVTKAAKYWKETIIILVIIAVLMLLFFLYKERIKEKLLEQKEERLEKKEEKLEKEFKRFKKKRK